MTEERTVTKMQGKPENVKKKCSSCGKLFTPSNNFQKRCHDCIEYEYEHRFDSKKKICSICGKEFIPHNNRVNECSDECREEKFRRSRLRICIVCGSEFYLPVGKKVLKCDKCKEKEIEDSKPRCQQCGKIFDRKSNSQKICEDCKKANKEQSEKDKIKVCRICGKTFTAKDKRRTYCYDKHPFYCSSCGKFVEDSTNFNREGLKCPECSRRERQEKVSQTLIEKYGSATGFQSPLSVERRNKAAKLESTKQKRAKTNLERYGATCFFVSEECKRRIQEKYGVKNVRQLNEVKEKVKQSQVEKYGGQGLQSQSIRAKYERTMIDKYGVNNPRLFPASKRNYKNKSSYNQLFKKLLENLGLHVTEEKFISPYSYDLFVENETLVEIDSTAFHNIAWHPFGEKAIRDRNYHLEKTNTAKHQGFSRVIHVFDWDDYEKCSQILRRDQKVLYARNLDIKEVSNTLCNSFEEQFHLQGKCRGQSVRLGLYESDKLIQIMTFGKPRYNKKYKWELLRLCTDFDYKVVGGAERLFKHFLKKYHPTSIISYCDLSKFTGNVYKRLGMTEAYTTKPQKIWSKGTQKITDNYLRQHGADRLISTSDGKGTDNEEIMLREGWSPVYDCGQLVFGWTRKNGD